MHDKILDGCHPAKLSESKCDLILGTRTSQPILLKKKSFTEDDLQDAMYHHSFYSRNESIHDIVNSARMLSKTTYPQRSMQSAERCTAGLSPKLLSGIYLASSPDDNGGTKHPRHYLPRIISTDLRKREGSNSSSPMSNSMLARSSSMSSGDGNTPRSITYLSSDPKEEPHTSFLLAKSIDSSSSPRDCHLVLPIISSPTGSDTMSPITHDRSRIVRKNLTNAATGATTS